MSKEQSYRDALVVVFGYLLAKEKPDAPIVEIVSQVLGMPILKTETINKESHS